MNTTDLKTRLAYCGLAILSLLGSPALPLQAQSAEPTALAAPLRQAYRAWIEAVEKRDAAAWANAITKHRQVITRNTLISQGLAFPRDVWDGLPAAPSLEKMRLLEAEAVGETAHLLYFGSLDAAMSSAQQAPPNLILLKFFHERGQWRFDSHKIISLMSNPKLREQLLNNEAASFLSEPMFTPPGKPPAVPPLCELPDFITGCTVTCPGWEVLLKINGQEHYAADGTLKFFIQGGLRKGENLIELEATAIEPPSQPERDLQVDLFLKPQSGQKVQRALHLETPQANETRARKAQWRLDMPATQPLNLQVP